MDMTTWASRVLTAARVLPAPPPPTDHRCDMCEQIGCLWHLYRCQREVDIQTATGKTVHCDCKGSAYQPT